MKDIARMAVALIIILCPALLISQNQARVDSLLYNLEVVRTDSARVNNLIELAKEYSAVDLAVSLSYAQRALDLAETTKDVAIISKSLFNIGYICFYHGLLDMATRHYYRYLDIHKAHNLFIDFYNEGQARISLVNVHGQIVAAQQVTDSGQINLEFNIHGLPQGIYMLQLDHGAAVVTEKVIVQ